MTIIKSMAQHTDAELLDLIDRTMSGIPSKIHTESEFTKLGSNTTDKMSYTLASMEPNCELDFVTKPGTRLPMKPEDSHTRGTEHVEQKTVIRQDGKVESIMEEKAQEPLYRKGMETDGKIITEIANDPCNINYKEKEDKMFSEKHSDELNSYSQKEQLACLTHPEIDALGDSVLPVAEGVPSTIQSDLHTESAQTSSSEFDAELVSLLSKDEIVNLVRECRTELEDTKKKLKRCERQLTKANDYNGVLRNMVEKLSGEIHRMKHTKLSNVHVQVDKEDFLAYTTGKMSMPNWQEEVDDHDSVSMDISLNEEGEAIKLPENEGPPLSIAEIVKQTAESVVQQQQCNLLYDQGYVYDENSGLYYHAASGYYYDQEKSLFYDPNAGIYYYYDYSTGKYLFHSQIDLQQQNQGSEQAALHLHTPNKKKSSGPRKGKIPARRGQERDQYPTDDKNTRNRGSEEEMINNVLCEFEDLKISPYARKARQNALDVAESWPPCIRVMVIESESLMVGTFFIVTCTGAKIGRENCDICVPDLNVSKVHAVIQYKEESGRYEILDMASQNGTFLNDQRLSPAKIASKPFVVSHDDVVLVGTTKLLCHIHTGSDTCDKCEPGVVIATHKAQQPQTELKVLSKEERLRQKKQELNQIKKKYGLKNSAYVDNKEVFNNPNYSDKAEERRKVVGSDIPGQKQEAPASVHRPISSSNVGHKLLQKMGWKEGESLGKNNSGLQEPISVTLRASQTAGLGSTSAGNFSADDANTFDMKKASRRVQAQQRYNQIESEHTGITKPNKQWNKGDMEFT